MNVVWYGEDAEEKIRKLALERIQRGAEVFAERLKSNIGQSGPQHSSPGEYPRKQSGELQRGIKIEKSDDSVSVVSTAPHTAYVESIRPFFQRTLEESQSDIKSAIEGR